MTLILANPQAITKTQFLKTETEANPEAQTSNTTNTFTRQTYIYFHKLIQESERERRRHTSPLAGSRVGTGRAATLLKMETAAATPHTQCVGLVPPLTETPCSLTLLPHFQHTDREI